MRKTQVFLIAPGFGKAKVSGCSFPKSHLVIMDQYFETILENRPEADSAIEQFLMMPNDVLEQAGRVGPYLRGHSVFF
jgi:hypothetical protein